MLAAHAAMVSLGGGLTTEAPTLHTLFNGQSISTSSYALAHHFPVVSEKTKRAATYTRETHTPAIRPSIYKLALLEPLGADDLADGQEALLVADAELADPPLGADALRREVAQQRARDVAGVLPAGADGDGPVAVAVARLVRDDLAAVELQHRARRAHARLRVVQRRHALLDRQRPRPQRRRVFLARQRRRRRGAQHAHVGPAVEAVGGRRVRDDGPDASGLLLELLWLSCCGEDRMARRGRGIERRGGWPGPQRQG